MQLHAGKLMLESYCTHCPHLLRPHTPLWLSKAARCVTAATAVSIAAFKLSTPKGGLLPLALSLQLYATYCYCNA